MLGRTGLRVSQLGFGAATLGDEYGIADAGECARAVAFAIDSGINFFDVAPYYGRTLAESRLGAALEGRRAEVILATKCGRYGVRDFDFSAARVRRSMDESLARLRTDYVDILHVHDIEFADRRRILEETVPELRRIQAAGKTRCIGISGLPVRLLRDVAVSGSVDCVLSYCRWNLLNRDLDPVLGDLPEKHGIGLINASPLHMRLLTDTGPPDWHPASPAVRSAALRIGELCRQRGHDVADTALRFAAAHPAVASTLSGISTVDELRRNLRTLEGPPDAALLRAIHEVAAPVLRVMWPSGRIENLDPEMTGA